MEIAEEKFLRIGGVGMKILITTDLYLPSVNGVVTSVLNLVNELTKKGHTVRILTISTEPKSYKIDNVYYIRSLSLKIYPDVRMPISYHNQFIDELIDWKPDVIHSQCEFFSFQFAKHISDKTEAPIVHTYHTLYEQYAGYIMRSQKVSNRMIAILSRERLRLVDVVIAPTAKVRESLKAYKLKNDIVVIPTGIEIDKYKSKDKINTSIIIKKELGIPEDYKILVSIGRLGTEKNIQELLYNMKSLLEVENKVIFVIVGGGPAREELEKLTLQLGISDNVRFTGMVSPEDVSSYYSLGDIFVCASTSETQGLTYIEAVANGLPLVCRRDACLENVIIDGLNGYQYTTTEEFIKYVVEIFSEPSWSGQAAYYDSQVISSFSKEHFADTIDELYNTIIKSRE